MVRLEVSSVPSPSLTVHHLEETDPRGGGVLSKNW